MKNIVVLGGGYAGVLTAKHLEKKLKKRKSEFKITLIDKNPYHTMLTELHEVAANRVDEDSIKMDLRKIFAERNVNVVTDTINKIDFAGNKLDGNTGTYKYDYLVIGSGSKPAFFGVEGADQNAFTLWSYDDAIRLREHILNMFRNAGRETDPKKRKQMLTFYVVGGGFTGVEMMGELAEWLPRLCSDYLVDKKEVTLVLVDMLDRILTTLPERLSNKAVARLEKMGVQVKTKRGVTKVGSDSIELKSGNNSEKHETNTIIWAAGIEGSQVVCDSDAGKQRGKRIETDEFLKSKEHSNVYVVGDNIWYTPKGEKMAVPQMVENAEASSKLVAENLSSELLGQGEKKSYEPKFHGMMVCIGGRYGMAYMGTHTKKFEFGSFIGMLSKHFINIIYFIQVLGWNKCWNYICHEFFRVKDNRSFVGGHLSNGAPSFWSFPLRLLLGFCWVIEGLAKLPKILIDPSNIFLFSIPGTDATAGATDATASASADVAPLTFADVNGFPDIFAKFGDWMVSTFSVPVAETGLPVPGFVTSIVDWSMANIIVHVAPLFQAFMVIAEIGLGVLLLLGLFTALSSVATVALGLMIYSSGMASPSILWYAAAAFALIGLGGKGHTLALDYYVLPWLKDKWKNIKIVRKLYIYND